MSDTVIYHNPSCSKSRAALALLEQNNVAVTVNYYLETAPSADDIRSLLEKLNINIRQLIRKSETQYKQLGLDDESLSDEIVFDLVCAHPRLIQRPIVVRGNKAIIARPPENVLQLL